MSLPQGLNLAAFRYTGSGSGGGGSGGGGGGKKPKKPATSAPRRPLLPAAASSAQGRSDVRAREGAVCAAGGDDDDFEAAPAPKKARAAREASGGGSSAGGAAAAARRGNGGGGGGGGGSGAKIADVVAWLSSQSTSGQLVHVHRAPARVARTKPLQYIAQLSNKKLKQTMQQRPLYTHQADAIDAVFEGDNVCVATGTASGKSRCFLVPCMEALKSEKDSRCLFIYPMKALAQDQRRAAEELAHATVSKKLKVSTYDGDTPEAERPGIRKSARIVLTNPDMLHVAVLPNHKHWEKFFSNLQFVIIDEAHTYRGLFGSHMAMIMRRLRRICKHYSCFPQFIMSSATISNPKPLCEHLIGLPVKVIDNDGSPSGERTICLWNPPLLDASGENTRRKSAASEATVIFTELVTRRLKSICFVRARKTAEVVLQQSKQKLASSGRADMHDQIMAYRAGYLPEERRAIEEKLFSGRLVGVTATTALELGVDVGGLDATVHVGYPGSVASMWQQAGRAGRGGQDCLCIVIGMESGLDQYFMQVRKTHLSVTPFVY
jgi:DEAD/DEAH box helicase domain-containing protein